MTSTATTTSTAMTQPAHPVPHRTRPAPQHAPPVDRRPGPWAPPAPAAVDPGLLAVLRCPLTGGRLIPVDADRLMSDRPFRDGVHPVYPVAHGIPCLLPAR